jgi:hypothetical protein
VLLRPRSLLLQAGAVAGAVLSIVGLIQLVAPNSDDGAATTAATAPPKRITLALAQRSVRVLTRREYLRSLGFPPQGEELDEVGFTVSYLIETRGYGRGSKLLVRYQLWEKTVAGERPLVSHWDDLEIDRDPDTCTCISTFMNLPLSSKRYFVSVGVFAPGVERDNPGHPLKAQETPPFKRPRAL